MPVPPINTSSPASKAANVSNAGSNPVPKGLASNQSSIQSTETQQSKGILTKVKDTIVNIFVRIKDAIKNVFYRLFFCKAPPSDVELKYLDFQSRLERVDSLSEELALKEAEEHQVVFTHYGQHVFKRSWNLVWRIWTSIPVVRNKKLVRNKTYYEIGRKEAYKNYKELIPHLKQYYHTQAKRLENQIRRSQDSN